MPNICSDSDIRLELVRSFIAARLCSSLLVLTLTGCNHIAIAEPGTTEDDRHAACDRLGRTPTAGSMSVQDWDGVMTAQCAVCARTKVKYKVTGETRGD